ncbi:MAG: hypothetical protein ACT4PK_07980 [Gammaproteobacteria bacterium]
MSHEARINDALKTLGEEFRLGMVQPEEYRGRRRLLLESWYEKEVTTSPGTVRSAGFSTIPPGKKKVLPISGGPKLALLGAAVVAGIVASAWFTFGPRQAAEPSVPPAAAQPALAPASPQVLVARKAAEDFLAGNAWEQPQVDAVLAHWRLLSAEDRARAREEPAFRTLRFKLDQNIQAESQLVAPDAPTEDRQRLDLLTRFAEELDA